MLRWEKYHKFERKVNFPRIPGKQFLGDEMLSG
jgi:hypothetical protein